MSDTLRALWRDQEARHPEPPTPALIDALYEAGQDALAWRLHWCREWGVVPRVLHGDVSYRYYTWHHWWVQRRAGEGFFASMTEALRSGRWWASTLPATYRLLLRIPQEKFPCK